jgi:hypothetical protein
MTDTTVTVQYYGKQPALSNTTPTLKMLLEGYCSQRQQPEPLHHTHPMILLYLPTIPTIPSHRTRCSTSSAVPLFPGLAPLPLPSPPLPSPEEQISGHPSAISNHQSAILTRAYQPNRPKTSSTVTVTVTATATSTALRRRFSLQPSACRREIIPSPAFVVHHGKASYRYCTACG